MHPTPEELATQLTAPREPRRCERSMPIPIATDSHYCQLWDCPTDDPDHIHQCYSDDFDWTEGEHQKYRLGLVTGPQATAELQQTCRRRAAERLARHLWYPAPARPPSVRTMSNSPGFISMPVATWRTET